MLPRLAERSGSGSVSLGLNPSSPASLSFSALDLTAYHPGKCTTAPGGSLGAVPVCRGAVGTSGRREGIGMASLELQKGWWRIVLRYGGKKHQRALDTRDRREAEAMRLRAEENLKLLKRGRLAYRPGDDLITLLLSDGTLNA